MKRRKYQEKKSTCKRYLPCHAVNYTIKCNSGEKKKEFIQICGKIGLRNKFYCKGDLYELQTFYHRKALLSTGILYQRKKLSGNRKAFGQKCQFGIQGVKTELYVFEGYTEVLPIYGAKEKRSSQQLPPPRDVLGLRGIGLHRRETVANVVARTDSQNAVRDEDAVV